MTVTSKIVDASKTLVDSADLIREWFPKRAIFLDCRVASYDFEPEEQKITYVLVMVSSGSGQPAIIVEGDTLYELLTSLYQKHLAVAADTVLPVE